MSTQLKCSCFKWVPLEPKPQNTTLRLKRQSYKMKHMKQRSTDLTSPIQPQVNTEHQFASSTGINASSGCYVWKRHGVFCTDSDFTMDTICSQIRPPVALFKIPYVVPADNEILKIMR